MVRTVSVPPHRGRHDRVHRPVRRRLRPHEPGSAVRLPGEIVAVASEHDQAAGTQRGPNTIFVFTLGGLRVAHFGDFGQAALRPEQAAAIGPVDLAFLPVGAGPTIGAEEAVTIARELPARWVVPMHYRTPRLSFLEPVDAFLERMPGARRYDDPTFDTAELGTAGDGPTALVPTAP